MTDDMPDLIHLAQQGDDDAFDALIKRYQGPIYKIARIYLNTRDDREDAVQICLWKVWRRLPTCQYTNFSAWIGAIMRHTCIDLLRRSQVHRKRFIPDDQGLFDVASEFSNPERLWIEQESYRGRLDLFRALAPNIRTETEMILIDELKYHQVARLRGIPVGTVKSRVNRGRRELQKRIKRV